MKKSSYKPSILSDSQILMSKPRTTPSKVYKLLFREIISLTTKMTLQNGASLRTWLSSLYENFKKNV